MRGTPDSSTVTIVQDQVSCRSTDDDIGHPKFSENTTCDFKYRNRLRINLP